MPILIKKMHEFCIEADVTLEEWMAACNLLAGAGQVTTPDRHEVVLCSDVFGIESLVGGWLSSWLYNSMEPFTDSTHLVTDTLDQTRAQRKAVGGPSAKGEDNTSFSAILGPFYRAGVPIQPNGTTIVRQEEPDAPYTHLFGVIHGADGKPLAGAVVDVWHDAVSGTLPSLRLHISQAFADFKWLHISPMDCTIHNHQKSQNITAVVDSALMRMVDMKLSASSLLLTLFLSTIKLVNFSQ